MLFHAVKNALSSMTVEPIAYMIGFSYAAMLNLREFVFMSKSCTTFMGYSDEVCSNLTSYPEENVSVQKEFSVLMVKNGAIVSVMTSICVLAIGSWSDKHGRKIPLAMSLISQVIWSGGYLLYNWQISWPLEVVYGVSLAVALFGGEANTVPLSVAYISDIFPAKSLTTKASIVMSINFIGAPLGNLACYLAIFLGGIDAALGLFTAVHFMAIAYLVLCLKESYRPESFDDTIKNGQQAAPEMNLKSTKSKLFLDFFNWQRMVDIFKTTFKKRDGQARIFIIIIVVTNMIRMALKHVFLYPFVHHVLAWDVMEYVYWMTYRNLVTALGSLILGPLLTRRLTISDPLLTAIGLLSMASEFFFIGFCMSPSHEVFMWLAPLLGILSNMAAVAPKAMATKLVTREEKGCIMAVISASENLVPAAGFAVYSLLYTETIESFPQAQFFLATSFLLATMVAYLIIHFSRKYDEIVNGGRTNTPASVYTIQQGVLALGESMLDIISPETNSEKTKL